MLRACRAHFTSVSLALATMAASSSSVMSMARLSWVLSVVLKVAGRLSLRVGFPLASPNPAPLGPYPTGPAPTAAATAAAPPNADAASAASAAAVVATSATAVVAAAAAVAASAAVAAVAGTYQRGCSGVLFVEDIERRQADVRNFLLTESNFVRCRPNGCRGCAARQRQRQPGGAQQRYCTRPMLPFWSSLHLRHDEITPIPSGQFSTNRFQTAR
jgi:hypothetical protein